MDIFFIYMCAYICSLYLRWIIIFVKYFCKHRLSFGTYWYIIGIYSIMIHRNIFWHYFRIKQEWNLILECRKKGIPQSKYLKNGFVNSNEKNLGTGGNTPQLKKSRALSDGVNKEQKKFIFQLSGEQWMVNIMENMFLLVKSLVILDHIF